MNLFLDDERYPPKDGRSWYIARNAHQAIWLIQRKRQCPSFISFDHDLGSVGHTGLDFAHWLIEMDMDYHGEFIPTTFQFYVHSQNPIGRDNIHSLLERYLNERFLAGK